SKTGLVSSSWERHFYFTQGGNLMSQARGEVAGGLVLDIDNCSVMAVDCEDRRYCFQITAFDGKNPPVLTAVCFLAVQETAARVNQSALDAVTPSPSFQQRHESLRPAATNPFGESGDGKPEETEDSILQQLYMVQFLGSMEVRSGESTDVIYETMRHILAARAIHNVFRMTESHLLVTCDCLKLIDPQTQVTRLRFPLSSVVLCASHQENKRLLGFVLQCSGSRAEGRPVSVCYVFESNNEGEKRSMKCVMLFSQQFSYFQICDSVGLAKQIAFHSDMDRRATVKQKELDKEKERQQEEISKQKQIEKDLEEQSRLIAASSRPNQAGGEAQVLVLSNSQSEDSDTGEEGKKKGESEA
ncbi:DCC-interacting protein 13-alpha, partial [Acipenser ruthenus]